jgi:hypothetical protein
MFIFTGDFEDPFNEFFVDKMYRRGVSKDSGSQEFMFKLTSEPDVKIPAFLLDITSLIFKTGSSIHFLKKENLKGIDKHSLLEYYQICCAEAINKFVTKLNGKEMTLDFDISKLRKD